MSTTPTNVHVALDARSYDITIGTALLGRVGELCTKRGLKGQALLVSDSHVDPLYGDKVAAGLDQAGIRVGRAVVPAGETSKSLDQLDALYDCAVEAGLDRKSFVVALGGGVVGDLAGYAAASFLRGIPYVQVPTSVVALVDSAVGGKTGINLQHGKNLVGAFHQPACVIADLGTLQTLPSREYISGLAEVVKYGVIRDEGLFQTLEDLGERLSNDWKDLSDDIVARCCEIKADVVSRDEREGGLRAILNFGHTLGHAIENVAGYGEFLHGEAIAMGMVYAGALSMTVRGFPKSHQARLVGLLETLGLPVSMPDLSWSELRRAIASDKKTVSAAPKFVLADRIGQVAFGCEVEEDTLEKTWNSLGGKA